MIVPEIEASQAYQNNGAIVLWWDETEGGDTSVYTIPEIIISPDAKGNAYANDVLYTHSSDLLTWQEVFGVGPCLLDACKRQRSVGFVRGRRDPQQRPGADVHAAAGYRIVRTDPDASSCLGATLYQERHRALSWNPVSTPREIRDVLALT